MVRTDGSLKVRGGSDRFRSSRELEKRKGSRCDERSALEQLQDEITVSVVVQQEIAGDAHRLAASDVGEIQVRFLIQPIHSVVRSRSQRLRTLCPGPAFKAACTGKVRHGDCVGWRREEKNCASEQRHVTAREPGHRNRLS